MERKKSSGDKSSLGPRPPGAAQDWRARLARELRAAQRLFVLGVGNPDRADDGAGGLCVRRLQRRIGKTRWPPLNRHGGRLSGVRPSHFTSRRREGNLLGAEFIGSRRIPTRPILEEIQALDGGEVPESATGTIRKFRPTHVLIIDAASAGNEPGTVFFVDQKEIREDELTTHRVPLSHLIRYLEKSVGCRVILLGIEPRRLAAGEPMSGEVTAAVAALVGAIAEALRD